MKRYQRGQALPLGMAMALIGMLVVFVLYNTGQAATDKARLANAADAAAYSGLIWQARALNFQAYTNRAMVANQVSIGQAVSLRSWSAYAHHTSRNLAAALSFVPIVNALAKSAAEMMQAIDAIVGPVSEGMVAVVDLVNRGIGMSQQAMFASSFAATPEIVREVVKSSDARFESDTLYTVAGLQGNLSDWNGFTRTYERDDVVPMIARTALVNDARDAFTKEREWELFADFWYYSTPIDRYKFFRQGRTVLVQRNGIDGPRWEWIARDTLSLHSRIWHIFGETKIELPVGWGQAHANDVPGSTASLLAQGCRASDPWVEPQCGWWTKNRSAEQMATVESRSMRGYSGLKAFRSLSEQSLEHGDGDPVLRLRTEVALDTSRVPTSESHVDSKVFATAVAAPGDRLSSISIAEVYYRRPDEGFGAALSDEAANGYNAFWSVRLAPIPDSERLLAVGLRGSGSSVTPAGGAQAAARGAVASLAGDPLPEYAASLAGAYAGDAGVDVAGLRTSIGAARGLGDLDLGGFVREADPVGIIEDELKRVLETAVRTMMSEWLSSARENTLSGLTDTIDNEQVDRAIAEASRLNADWEKTREQVAERIEPEVGRIVMAMGARRTELNEIIADAQQEMSRMNADRFALERRIEQARDERKGLKERYTARLATTFQQIVLDVDPDWPIPDRMAFQLMDVLVDGYIAGVAEGGTGDVTFTWSDEDEEEDEDEDEDVDGNENENDVDGDDDDV